jgi:uncharacterized membrane protein YdbT with pleckstrin-like domain
MGYVERLLAEDERVVFVTRRHWLALLTTILVDVGIAVVIVALSVGGFVFSPPLPLFGLVLLLVPVGHFLSRFLVWRNEQYVVTNRRVLEVRGMFRKYVSDSSLEMVNDVVMEQSALGRVLDYGDLRIITGSDIGANAFRRIGHPIRFKTAMLNQKSRLAGFPAPESGEVEPDDVPELLARLGDLRQRGVLTEEEFQEEKRQLLERL